MAYFEDLGSYQATKNQRKRLDYLAELCKRGSLTEASATVGQKPTRLSVRVVWAADKTGKIMVSTGTIWRNGYPKFRNKVMEKFNWGS